MDLRQKMSRNNKMTMQDENNFDSDTHALKLLSRVPSTGLNPIKFPGDSNETTLDFTPVRN